MVINFKSYHQTIMWFLQGTPTAITVKAVVSSLENGYQQTSYRFTINSEQDKCWIAIAFPWAPHKTNGGLKITTDNPNKYCPDNELQILSENDVIVWERLRSLKKEKEIELIHVQELINWYLDDIGVMTFWAQPRKTYQITFTHKIAADSKLFLATRLPSIIAARKPEMNYELWAIDSLPIDIPKYLHKEPTDADGVDHYRFKDWNWDSDTRLSTDNWASSDDELDSD